MSTIKVDTIKDTNNVEVYTAKAWVNFDGSQAAADMIRESGNISSITDNGTGDYTLNFTNAMEDANYSTVASNTYSGLYSNRTAGAIVMNTGNVRIVTQNYLGSGGDSDVITVAVFR